MNSASGSVGPGAAEALEALVAEFGLSLRLSEPEPRDIPVAVRAAVEADPDLVVVLAGDGTARLAASLAGPKGPLVAPLPGGTMNMLPHAIYGRKPWKQALSEALSGGVERTVPGGEVDGHAFYVAAILGSPALWAEAREAVRHRRLRDAALRVRRAFLQTFSGRLRFRLAEGPARKAEALTLMSPLISRAMAAETALEVAALDVRNAGDALRLGLRAMVGEIAAGVGADLEGWRADPSVSVELCEAGRAWASGRIPAILDGEPMRLPRSVAFRFRPAAFRALGLPPSPDAANG